MKSLTDQLATARRELEMRKRNYPRWVRDGKLAQQIATHEIETQNSICQTLQKLLWLEQVTVEILSR